MFHGFLAWLRDKSGGQSMPLEEAITRRRGSTRQELSAVPLFVMPSSEEGLRASPVVLSMWPSNCSIQIPI